MTFDDLYATFGTGGGPAYVGSQDFQPDTDTAHTTNEFGLDYVERRWTGSKPNLTTFLASVADTATDPEFSGINVKQRGRKIQKLDEAWPTVIVTYCGRLDGGTGQTPVVGVDSYSIKTIQAIDGAGQSVRLSCYQYQTTYLYAVSGSRPTNPVYSGPTNSTRTIEFFDIQPPNFTNPFQTSFHYVNRCEDLEVAPAGLWWEVREVWTRTVSTLATGAASPGVSG